MTSVPSVSKPVLYLGFLLGLVPYSVTANNLFIPASLYTLSLILLVWQSYTKILSMILKEIVTDLYAYGYLLPLLMTLNSVVSLTSWVSVLYRYQMWIEFLKQIDILNQTVKDSAECVEASVIQFLGIILMFLFTSIYYFSFYFQMLELSWVVVCGQSLSTAVNILLLIEFFTYITLLKSNFSLVNKHLDNLEEKSQNRIEENCFWKSISDSKESLSVFVSSMRDTHRQLYSLSTHINNIFGCQLLATVSKAIVLITIILYTISLTFLGKADTITQGLPVYLAVMCSVLVQNMLELLLLVFICSSVSDQVSIASETN